MVFMIERSRNPVAHVLRKYNPREWGGTETSVLRLMDGLAAHGARSIVLAPRLEGEWGSDPFCARGHEVRRFRAFLPVWGLPESQRKQLVSVGGNLMSFDLAGRIWCSGSIEVVHSHALNRLGAMACWAARARGCPFVVTIHGGWSDLPSAVAAQLVRPLEGGFEWGKLLGMIIGSRRVIARADGVVTCNQREADGVAARFPGKPILVQPHGVPCRVYQRDCREETTRAYPQVRGRDVLLCVGRIDPVKNQAWVAHRMPELLRRHPKVLLVLAGPCTDAAYGQALRKTVNQRGLDSQVVLTGGLFPEDPRLIGLYQTARVLVQPSLSETFGLVILEAWAAGCPVMAAQTSGALELIRDRENGWLFQVERPESFHGAVDECLRNGERAREIAACGQRLVVEKFDTLQLADRMMQFYISLKRGKPKCDM